MRRLTILIADKFRRRDIPPVPPPQTPMSTIVRQRATKMMRRRLSDRVLDVFNEALIGGDLDTAEELLTVLDAMHARRQAAIGDRRLSYEDVAAARQELLSRRAEREAAAAAMADLAAD